MSFDFVVRMGQKRPADAEIEGFDLLRARLEIALGSPAVIAVTSATTKDGREIAARGLAYSLTQAGYSTLFIDTALATRALPTAPRGLDGLRRTALRRTVENPTLPALMRGLAVPPVTAIASSLASEGTVPQISAPGAANGRLATMTLNDIMLQRTTSLPAMKAALNILRSKFDYVVISTEFGMSTAFGAAISATADAVLVSYKKGRRKTADDTRLAAALTSIGPRFLGMVEIFPAVIDLNVGPDVASDAVVPSCRRRSAFPWLARFARAKSRSLVSAAKLECLPSRTREAMSADTLVPRESSKLA